MNKKALASMAFLVLFTIVPVQASSCTTNTYTVTPGFDFKGIIKFDYLDLNIRQGGIQNTLVVSPGQRVTAQVRWTFGTSCSECKFYINVYGSWKPGEEIAKLYSGPISTTPSISVVPLPFKAPTAQGEHILRVIFSLGEGYAEDFQALNIIKSPCVENRHVFFFDGLLNVSSTAKGEALEIKITSPKSKTGFIEETLGKTIDINANISGNVSDMTLYIDGRNLSKVLPYSWSTSNESEGVHVITLEAIDLANNTVRKEIKVELLNRSATGELPPIIWANEIGGGVGDLDFSRDGRIILVTGKDYLSLYDQDGIRLWRRTIKGSPKVSLSPDGKKIATALRKEIHYLSDTGVLIWNYTLPGDAGDIALTNSSFVAVTSGRKIYYIDSNGTRLWNRSLDDTINMIAASGDSIAATAKNRVYLLSNDSTVMWTYITPALINTLAASAKGEVVIGTQRDIYYLSGNGTLKWNFLAPAVISSIAISADGKYLAAASGKILYFFEGTSLLWSQQIRNPIQKVFLSDDGANLVFATGSAISLTQNFQVKKGWGPELEDKKILALVLAGVMIIVFYAYVSKKRKPALEAKRPVKEEKKAGINLEAVSEGLQIFKEGSLLIDVLNSKTKRPVIKASVVLDGRVRETNEKGRVIFEDLSKGRYDIKIEREFYKTVEEKYVFRGPEEHLRIELTPVFGLRDADMGRLKNALGALKKNYQVVSSLDSCLPSYYKSIGENVVDFVETVSDIPSYFKAFNYEDVIENLISVADLICRDLSEIMVEWKNVKLYEVGGKTGAECKAKPFRGLNEFEKAVTAPEEFIELSKSTVRQRLSIIDGEITDKIKELTIMPLSGLWRISEKLIRLAEEKPGHGAEDQLRIAILLIFADSLLDYVEEMLQNDEVIDRLKHSIL